MSAVDVEAFLARIYVDAEARARFLADPHAVAAAAGLDAEECDALATIDREGLALAARIFARKRAERQARPPALARIGRWLSWWR